MRRSNVRRRKRRSSSTELPAYRSTVNERSRINCGSAPTTSDIASTCDPPPCNRIMGVAGQRRANSSTTSGAHRVARPGCRKSVSKKTTRPWSPAADGHRDLRIERIVAVEARMQLEAGKAVFGETGHVSTDLDLVGAGDRIERANGDETVRMLPRRVQDGFVFDKTGDGDEAGARRGAAAHFLDEPLETGVVAVVRPSTTHRA